MGAPRGGVPGSTGRHARGGQNRSKRSAREVAQGDLWYRCANASGAGGQICGGLCGAGGDAHGPARAVSGRACSCSCPSTPASISTCTLGSTSTSAFAQSAPVPAPVFPAQAAPALGVRALETEVEVPPSRGRGGAEGVVGREGCCVGASQRGFRDEADDAEDQFDEREEQGVRETYIALQAAWPKALDLEVCIRSIFLPSPSLSSLVLHPHLQLPSSLFHRIRPHLPFPSLLPLPALVPPFLFSPRPFPFFASPTPAHILIRTSSFHRHTPASASPSARRSATATWRSGCGIGA
ncbi:hypothetical protein DFH06DRAFT_105639 [Mycena polygramma]|nr:hypothetical protein DFH06DRAFT_105639 [Mycena polygramma]